MAFKILIFTCLTLTVVFETTSAICLNVPTNTGTRNLADNEYACRALGDGETSADLGKYFWRCTSGVLANFNCSTLRWDNINKVCNWPAASNCDIDPVFAQVTTTTTQPGNTGSPAPTASPTTSAPPTTCSATTCQLPNCFCYGNRPSLSVEETPQFVMLTFDDAVTPSVFNVYQKLFVNNYWNVFNPNNCSIKSTFFITHNFTDYSLVQLLHGYGHEIADHTISHGLNTDKYSEVYSEIVGLRDIIVNKTTIKADDVKGFRAPFLRIYGDTQYSVMKDNNFSYDSSISNIEMQVGRDPIWPHTLDFVIEDSKCPNRPCPVSKHPGIWEIPMNSWVGSNGFSCSMIDGCSIKDNDFNGTVDDFLGYFRNNFNKFYPKRIPMNIFSHASMFMKFNAALEALGIFMQELQSKGVWFATPSQVIFWMQNQVTNQQLKETTFACAPAELQN